MPLSLLSDNPLYFIIWIAAILTALSAHEFLHAYTAYRLGDDTAEAAGRLTLNPMAHIDWLGLLTLILIGFGWGKPVPVNPYNLKYKKWGNTLVALSGPLANFLSIVVFGFFLKFLEGYIGLTTGNLLVQFVGLLIIINVVLMIFNLIPVPPLDGSAVLFAALSDPKYDDFKARLILRGPMILLGLLLLDNLFNIGIFSAIFSRIVSLVFRIF